MFSIILAILGILVSILIFVYSNLKDKYNNAQIVERARNTKSLRFLVLAWIIRKSDVEEIDRSRLEENRRRRKKEKIEYESGYLLVKEYNTKIVQFSIAPNLSAANVRTAARLFSYAIMLAPPTLTIWAASNFSLNENFAAFILFVSILWVPVAYVFKRESLDWSYSPVVVALSEGILRLEGGRLEARSRKRYREIEINRDMRFVLVEYKWLIFMTVGERPNGIALKLSNDVLLGLVDAPRWWIRALGDPDILNIVDRLNHELSVHTKLHESGPLSSREHRRLAKESRSVI